MRRFISISAVLLVLTLVSLPVLAQQHQHGADHLGTPGGKAHQSQSGFEHPVLGHLSGEQQERLAKLTMEHRQAMMQHTLRMRAKQAELDMLLAASEFDKAKVDALTAEIIDLKGEAMKLRNDLRRKVFEETGHLMQDKAVGDYPRRSGIGNKHGMGRTWNCPMMSGLGAH